MPSPHKICSSSNGNRNHGAPSPSPRAFARSFSVPAIKSVILIGRIQNKSFIALNHAFHAIAKRNHSKVDVDPLKQSIYWKLISKMTAIYPRQLFSSPEIGDLFVYSRASLSIASATPSMNGRDIFSLAIRRVAHRRSGIGGFCSLFQPANPRIECERRCGNVYRSATLKISSRWKSK